MEYVVGIDEAGRGPIAGPVAVGAVHIPKDFDWKRVKGVRDSKKLSERKREEIFSLTRALKKEGVLDYTVSLVSATVIDRCGITKAVECGIARVLGRLGIDARQTLILLDGRLKAPEKYAHQETIIGGDGIKKEIGLASIMAKVTRDKHMLRQAQKYPPYGFETHKGYGTKGHYEAIRKHKMCPIHRRSFLTK